MMSVMTSPLPDHDLNHLDVDALRRHAVAFATANSGVEAGRLVLVGSPARAYLWRVANRISDRLTLAGDPTTHADVLLRIWSQVDPDFPPTPRPLPSFLRALRVVMCRRCAVDTGTPGAAFCDRCRPLGDPALATDVDRDRDRVA